MGCKEAITVIAQNLFLGKQSKTVLKSILLYIVILIQYIVILVDNFLVWVENMLKYLIK